jgi:NAD+ kinase
MEEYKEILNATALAETKE